MKIVTFRLDDDAYSNLVELAERQGFIKGRKVSLNQLLNHLLLDIKPDIRVS